MLTSTIGEVEPVEDVIYFWQGKATYVIVAVMYPLLLIIGTFGNILTYNILHRTTLGDRSAASWLFKCLAIMCLSCLWIALPRHWLRTVYEYDIRRSHYIICKMHRFLLYCVMDITAWVIVFISSDRLITVFAPSRANQLCTARNAKVAFIGLCIFFAAFNAHIFVAYGREYVRRGPGSTTTTTTNTNNNDSLQQQQQQQQPSSLSDADQLLSSSSSSSTSSTDGAAAKKQAAAGVATAKKKPSSSSSVLLLKTGGVKASSSSSSTSTSLIATTATIASGFYTSTTARGFASHGDIEPTLDSSSNSNNNNNNNDGGGEVKWVVNSECKEFEHDPDLMVYNRQIHPYLSFALYVVGPFFLMLISSVLISRKLAANRALIKSSSVENPPPESLKMVKKNRSCTGDKIPAINGIEENTTTGDGGDPASTAFLPPSQQTSNNKCLFGANNNSTMMNKKLIDVTKKNKKKKKNADDDDDDDGSFERTTTRLTIAASVEFVLTATPAFCFDIAEHWLKDNAFFSGGRGKARFQLVYNTVRLLLFSNFALHFFLFCFTVSRFRNEFKKLLKVWQSFIMIEQRPPSQHSQLDPDHPSSAFSGHHQEHLMLQPSSTPPILPRQPFAATPPIQPPPLPPPPPDSSTPASQLIAPPPPPPPSYCPPSPQQQQPNNGNDPPIQQSPPSPSSSLPSNPPPPPPPQQEQEKEKEKEEQGGADDDDFSIVYILVRRLL